MLTHFPGHTPTTVCNQNFSRLGMTPGAWARQTKVGALLVLAIYLLSTAIQASSQTNPALESGVTAYGTYHGGDIDTVSMANGNVFVHIPLLSYPQRGGKLSLGFFIRYNAKSWYTDITCFPSSGTCSGNWRYQDGYGRGGVDVAKDQTLKFNSDRTQVALQVGGTTFTQDVFLHSLISPDGASHQVGQSSGLHRDFLPAVDGSGYTLLPQNQATDRNGVRYSLVSAGIQTQDTNGNKITVSPSGWTDTLGRFIPGSGTGPGATSKTDNSGTAFDLMPGLPTTDLSACKVGTKAARIWNVPAFNGSAATYKLCYGDFPFQTNFNLSAVNPNVSVAEASGTARLLHQIVLPNGKSWNFSYDSYLNLTSIAFPTGGTISYSWGNTAYRPSSKVAPITRTLTTRTINANDGSPVRIWRYQWLPDDTFGEHLKWKNVVTDPDGNEEVHYVRLFQEYRAQFFKGGCGCYPGSSSGTLLKTVNTENTFFGNDLFIRYTGEQASLAPAPGKVTTVWPNGQVSQVQKTFTQTIITIWDFNDPNYIQFGSQPRTTGIGYVVFGNEDSTTELDFAQNTPGVIDPASVNPGPALRKTTTTYRWQDPNDGINYRNAGLVSLPASIVISDGTGNRCSETDYIYDEGAVQGSGISTQHDAAPGPVRGNLTKTKRWLSQNPCQAGATGLFLEATNTYLDTGNVLTGSDFGQHQTTFEYSSNFAGAYVTKTTNALGHPVVNDYDFNTGLLKLIRDPNLKETKHTLYDGMGRLKRAEFPDGGVVDIAFNEGSLPFSVTSTTTIAAGTTVVRTAVVDGLGRVKQTKLESDPDGLTFEDTAYDANGRVASKSNPYRSTGDSTYGITNVEYDALDRPVKVMPPDGTANTNHILTEYVGNQTTVTDQQKRQRKTITDGLGRLVTVHEPGGSGVPSKGTANVPLNGQAQSTVLPGQAAVSATGSVAINGAEQSTQVDDGGACNPVCGGGITVYDAGSVSITVNGYTRSVSYGRFSTATSIAFALRDAFNNAGAASPVSATASGATVFLTARATGASTNYTLSTTSQTSRPDLFSGPSFWGVRSGTTLIGGQNATQGPTVWDNGSVWVIVANFTANTPYDQNSTPATLASSLAQKFNSAVNSPVDAVASGSTLTLTSRMAGVVSNYTVMTGSGTSQPQYFSQPSFSAASPAGNALAGGDDGLKLSSPAITKYFYDALDNLTQVEQWGTATSCDAATCRKRTFKYDSLSRLTRADNPESGTITYTYDNENLTAKTSPAPNQTGALTQTMSYCYDTLHRLTQKFFAANPDCVNGTPPVKYFYDDQTARNGLSIANGIGRRTGMNDESGQAAWSYDAMGRPVTERRTLTGVTKVIDYTYNFDGSVKELTYPHDPAATNPRKVTYTVGRAGRILQAIDSNGVKYVTNATYAPQGALAGLKNGEATGFGGIVSSFTYNQRLQPKDIVATTGSVDLNCPNSAGKILHFSYNFNLGFANNGNVMNIVNCRNGSRSQSFGYDDLNRLKTAGTASTWGNNYVYDAWANLLQKNVTQGSAESLSVTMNVKNQMQPSSTYGYDAAGNLIKNDTANYTYDAENRLSTAGGGTYIYDGDGKRVKKSSGTLYWTAMGSDALAESDLQGNITDEYIFFNGKRVARRKSDGTVNYYFADHLGSSRVVTSAIGTVLDDCDYFPFGGETGGCSSSGNHYKFTGKERDIETGLDFFGARYYSTNFARFLQPDEFTGGPIDLFSSNDPYPPGPLPYADIGNPQSLNKYTYTFNNPLRYTDPNGHCVEVLSCTLELGAAGSAVGPVGTVIGALAGLAIGAAIVYAGKEIAATVMESSAADQPAHPAEKKVPNPYGSKGDPNHQGTAEEEAKAMPGGETEVTIKTPGGHKGSRRADAAQVDKSGNYVPGGEIVQVHRPTKTGNTRKREREAAEDIQNATGVAPRMVPVRPQKSKKPTNIPPPVCAQSGQSAC